MQQQPEFLAFPSEIHQEIIQCPKCDRWSVGMHNDHVWAAHAMESQGLLSACMKKIHALQQHQDVKILDASWIWTEPHSKRLKFFIDSERLIFEQRLPIRQRVLCTYIIKNSQCRDCIIKNSDHTWSAQLQVRQTRGKEHTQNIEQILIRHKLGSLMNDVKMVRDGMDLCFDSKQSLERVQAVLLRSLPCVVRSTSKKLISRDAHTNVARTEHVVVVEVVPLLKNDLVLLGKPHIAGKAVGIVRRVTSTVQVSLLRSQASGGKSTSSVGMHHHHVSLTADKVFKNHVPVLIPAGERRYLSRFIVLDVTMHTVQPSADGDGDDDTGLVSMTSVNTLSSGRLSRAEVDVMREDDSEVQYRCETDIGHVLQPGDTVLGYDTQRWLPSLQDASYDTPEATFHVSTFLDVIPDVVLVSKVFDEDVHRRRSAIEAAGPEDEEDKKKKKKKKLVSGGGGVKKRNRVPPWRRNAAAKASQVTGVSSETIVEGDEEDAEEDVHDLDEDAEGEEEGGEEEDEDDEDGDDDLEEDKEGEEGGRFPDRDDDVAANLT
jgi:nonsense-mediated mRNA decay protein 3